LRIVITPQGSIEICKANKAENVPDNKKYLFSLAYGKKLIFDAPGHGQPAQA
jgi:hypothetical protein